MRFVSHHPFLVSTTLLLLAALIYVRPAQAAGPTVLIAPGWAEDRTEANAAKFDQVYGDLEAFLTSHGYNVHRVYPDTEEPFAASQVVCDELAATGAVAIVGHSQGGLEARYCVEHLDGDADVHMIDSPHSGLSWFEAWVTGLDHLRSTSSFMRALNASPNTPAPHYWLNMAFEETLAGACNIDLPGSWSASKHAAAPSRDDVQGYILQTLAGDDPCAPSATATPQEPPEPSQTPQPTATTQPSPTATAAPTQEPECSWWSRLIGRC